MMYGADAEMLMWTPHSVFKPDGDCSGIFSAMDLRGSGTEHSLRLQYKWQQMCGQNAIIL